MCGVNPFINSDMKVARHFLQIGAKTVSIKAAVHASHPGRVLIRELYDSFDIQGPFEKHNCLVLQPMHMTILEMMGLNPKSFDVPLLKMTLKRLLLALDYLHTAEAVHTGKYSSPACALPIFSEELDLKTDNLMLSLEDNAMLADFAKAEAANPSPRKEIDGSRIIYQSRRFRRSTEGKSYGLSMLCDFGEARIGKIHTSGPFVQPHIYRAPEVIFEMPWERKTTSGRSMASQLMGLSPTLHYYKVSTYWVGVHSLNKDLSQFAVWRRNSIQ